MLILQIAIGTFVGILAYRFLIGFPGPTEEQLQAIWRKLDEIQAALPEPTEEHDDN